MARLGRETNTKHRIFSYLCAATVLSLLLVLYFGPDGRTSSTGIPVNAREILLQCDEIQALPGPLPGFSERKFSDRFVPGTKDVWIRNATIWTGRVDGLETIHGDLLLSGGLIKHIGPVTTANIEASENFEEIDVRGAWITPGIVDVHSHMGVESSPMLSGAVDGNSIQGTIRAWLRSLDGLNTHDESFHLAVSGGLTTSLILPGSANAIGGQAYAIKLRPTLERSPTAMLLEPPLDISGTASDYVGWKHMKHACGENPARVYGDTRMDSVWAWRDAYNTARKLKEKQDSYCASVRQSRWDNLSGAFPQDLQWQPLVDILRGKVKVQTHCYEAVDFDNFVRLSNEFKFPVAAFHHAHEAYLVPDVLKHAYGPTPAVAIFAAFSGYKREAYHSTSFAARLLDDEGIRSDHPAITSRFLLYEAQQVHHFGLPGHKALSSVTSTAAAVLGLNHRIGFIKLGYDADVVVWDRYPLALGATPQQVFIDGIPQLVDTNPRSGSLSQQPPKVPNYDLEAYDALKREGEPTLDTVSTITGRTIFTNVSNVWTRNNAGVSNIYNKFPCVIVEGGHIIEGATHEDCVSLATQSVDAVVDLNGGSIAPAIVAAGTSIGLQEIAGEVSTIDGVVFEPSDTDAPRAVLGTIPRAVDGLMYATRDAVLSYRAGVTTAVSAPSSSVGEYGLSASISTGVQHKLVQGAVVQADTAIYISLQHGTTPSISTRIASLRRLILGRTKGEAGSWFGMIALGLVRLVVRVDSADIIATLIDLKREVEAHTGAEMKLTVLGAAEAHILADELAAASVGVLVQPRSFPYAWDSRRILPGPPLSEMGQAAYLWSKNVTVGLIPQGIDDSTPSMTGWAARNLRWDAGWVASQSNLSMEDALALVSTNVDALLGVIVKPADADLVATSGGDLLSFEGKVVAVISPRRSLVDLF
ncbi:hypothetical protein K488DRAFT_88507 [Vararia minispora EC-137]|uniref:Uncharacterized protein n=1 Tax=Vararia minispora EC-137 TaxID=1314806 RepID=A0ACB8QCX3_9AGAM|nr:hypothetical protein K488DRAFT_88507 [Vararia minispora EC-137]